MRRAGSPVPGLRRPDAAAAESISVSARAKDSALKRDGDGVSSRFRPDNAFRASARRPRRNSISPSPYSCTSRWCEAIR